MGAGRHPGLCAAELPNAAYVEFPQQRHLGPFIHPDEFADFIGEHC